ncbi:MAG: Asp-tRNA(Asn)/Glu-tRNA(Gln) amidotransferase subunit GatB [bacterium]|nr:Asp-tRNA(Asn)/Glu-tRNA(Gln) amidotransferase subunit GatB [bacterium]
MLLKVEPIIGLEVHVELSTESKMFCSCSASHFGVEPNTHTCPVCLGLPGALPFPNSKAIDWTILVGLALGCSVNLSSKFNRKNYFYPDLSKGYQISQYDKPLAVNGKWLMVNGGTIRIRRVHLEEDTGKLAHTDGNSLIDFNRSGVPLVEIVTEPDFTNSQDTKVFLQKLQQLVRYLGVSEADMEKGQMRCEPNVNLKITKDDKIFYTPITEIKNVNSFRFVSAAIEFEITRLREEFEKNGVVKEDGNKVTRGWDEKKQQTFSQRTKEEAQDYRYFPEPDIPPVKISKLQITNFKSQIPELPDEKFARFIKDYHLPENIASILIETRKKADYYEEVVKSTQGFGPLEIANLLVNKKISSDLSPEEFIKEMQKRKEAPSMDAEKIEEAVREVVLENSKVVEDYKKGKITVIEFLVGQVARKTKGQSDPNMARKMLQDLLATGV